MATQAFHHEQLYRDNEVIEKLKSFPVTVCGAGALGANLLDNLARAGCGSLRVIDRDRIEERNLSTQPWFRNEIGSQKATIIATHVYRALGTRVEGVAKELNAGNAHKLLGDGGLVVDAFDNSVSRGVLKQYCADAGVECLHAGMAKDYSEVIWNENYVVPSDANDDVCDYPLARNLAVITAAIAAELTIRFIAAGEKQDYTFTLGDFAVRRYE